MRFTHAAVSRPGARVYVVHPSSLIKPPYGTVERAGGGWTAERADGGFLCHDGHPTVFATRRAAALALVDAARR